MDALIHHLEAKQDLSSREVEVAADLLLDAAVPDAKKEHLLEALSNKGETPGEIAGFVEAFLGHAVWKGRHSMSAAPAAINWTSSTSPPPRCSWRRRPGPWW